MPPKDVPGYALATTCAITIAANGDSSLNVQPIPVINPHSPEVSHPVSLLNALSLYRLGHWQGRESRARLFFYLVLGYGSAGLWRPAPILLNTLALFGIMTFQTALNDYWDARLLRERNWIGGRLESGRLVHHQALALILAPLALCAPIVFLASRFNISPLVILLLALGVGLAAAYSCPPLRLKRLRPWGLGVAPTLTALLILEAHAVLRPLTPTAICLAVLVWLFQLYAELLRIVVTYPSGVLKCSPVTAFRTARRLPWVSGGLALSMLSIHPAFAFSAAAALVRGQALRGPRVRRRIAAGRLNLFSGLLCLYEFLGYVVVGLCGRTFGWPG